MSDIYDRRYLKSRKFLRGRGLEIGAGNRPQALPEQVECVYFDSREPEELAAHFGQQIEYEVHSLTEVPWMFPHGADFLIAHHVLEHTPDPVGTLREWHRMLTPGGVAVISLPCHLACPDRDRLRPDLEHLVLDHLLQKDGDSFESREHVLSFLLSWVDDSPGLASLDKSACCREILANSRRSGHDFHWHAFDHPLSEKMIAAAALLDGLLPRFHVTPEPGAEDDLDMTYVYALHPRSAEDDVSALSGGVTDELQRIARKLARASAAVERSLGLPGARGQ